MAPAGVMGGLAFIDSGNNYLGFDDAGRLLTGRWTLTGSSWAFDPSSSVIYISFNPAIVAGMEGSGTLNARVGFSGQYGPISPSLPIAYAYSNANALAVMQSDLAGNWSASEVAISIDATGALTGRYTSAAIGDCALAGSVPLATPSSSKNLFAVTVNASSFQGAACSLAGSGPFTGFASLTFLNIGSAGAPSYVRTLTFLIRRNTATLFVGGELLKN